MLFLILNVIACGEKQQGAASAAVGNDALSDISGPIADEISPPENDPPASDVMPVEQIKFIAMPWDKKHPDTDQWNIYAYEALTSDGSHMLDKAPSDAKSFCPNYSNLNQEGRRMFWIALIASMAKFESAYRPETSYTESFTDSSGQRVVSRGLLQLSFESAKAYGCPLNKAQDLHDSEINLLCTVKILDRWLMRDGVITSQVNGSWRGGARYWSVLRKSSTLDQIKAMTAATEVCR